MCINNSWITAQAPYKLKEKWQSLLFCGGLEGIYPHFQGFLQISLRKTEIQCTSHTLTSLHWFGRNWCYGIGLLTAYKVWIVMHHFSRDESSGILHGEIFRLNWVRCTEKTLHIRENFHQSLSFKWVRNEHDVQMLASCWLLHIISYRFWIDIFCPQYSYLSVTPPSWL